MTFLKNPLSFFTTHKRVSLVVLAVIVIVALELTDTTHLFHEVPVPPVIPVTSSSSGKADVPAGSQQQAAPSSSDKATPTPASSNPASTGLALSTPYGNFVSNHAPGTNGSPIAEDSVCNTTPGAKCYIKFTKSDGTASQLPTQVTGSDGSTRWSWNSSILSSGNWTVTAVSTLNGQTKSTQDPTPLTIK